MSASTIAESRESLSTKEMLDKQKKFTISLPKALDTAGRSPDKSVQINGHTYQIRRDEAVEVPESVYLVLVQGGDVPPQREEDKKYRPSMTYEPMNVDGTNPISKQVPRNIQ